MLLCFGKDCCASGKFLVFWKRLLCSRIDCCVLEKIVVFSKRLLCSSKDCCVSEQELSCVLPLWATVPENIQRHKETVDASKCFKEWITSLRKQPCYFAPGNTPLRPGAKKDGCFRRLINNSYWKFSLLEVFKIPLLHPCKLQAGLRD